MVFCSVQWGHPKYTSYISQLVHNKDEIEYFQVKNGILWM